MYVYLDDPTDSSTPCPGEMAFIDGRCPAFTCNGDDTLCLNGGSCNAINKCDCITFSGINCGFRPGKIIQHCFFLVNYPCYTHCKYL